MAELLYQGHGSYRIVSNEGVVIYVDPYAGEGYDMPADIVIVTHEHSDHNQVGSLTVVSDFSLTKSLKTLIISMLLSFFIVKFVKINVLIWANVCYNRHRR